MTLSFRLFYLFFSYFQLWDYGTGKIVSSIKWPSDERRGEYLYCARFWDENHVVAGGSGTNDLKLINIATNEVFKWNIYSFERIIFHC